jgi:hypothetical protein
MAGDGPPLDVTSENSWLLTVSEAMRVGGAHSILSLFHAIRSPVASNLLREQQCHSGKDL